jgi:hypothetical protein
LRWARNGGVDLLVPAAAAIVVFNALPQFATTLWVLPFWAAWTVATSLGIAGALALRLRTPDRDRRRMLALPEVVLVIGIVASWIVYDLILWQHTIVFYDLDVYLGSAARWLDGGHAYMTTTVTAWPASAKSDFFLYPPPLLPVFGLLSLLPAGAVAVGFTAAKVACAYRAGRWLGLSRTCSVALLAFPPVMIGFASGNIASLTFLLFVAGAKSGGALIVDGLFKVQSGLPALWLIRQRRGRGILAGALAVLAIVLVTLPLVGFDSWREWWNGLGFRAASQADVPALFGYSYAQWLPWAVYAAVAAALFLLAVIFRGRRGLSALGLASIFASPALWPHGFIFALPAVLTLENGAAVWLVLGAGAFGSNMWLLFMAGWIAVLAAGRMPAGRLHPLRDTDGPWPHRLTPRVARRTGLPPSTTSGPDPTA